jgi:hypothetical protein
VQWNDLFVRLLDPHTGRLLREHVRAPRGWHRIADAYRPPRTPPKTVALLEIAVSGQRDRRTVVPLTPRCRAASSTVRCSRG